MTSIVGVPGDGDGPDSRASEIAGGESRDSDVASDPEAAATATEFSNASATASGHQGSEAVILRLMSKWIKLLLDLNPLNPFQEFYLTWSQSYKTGMMKM